MNEVKTSKPVRRFRRVVVVALVGFAAMQLIPASRTNPQVETDFLSAASVPQQEAQLLRGACYDCHSHETRWPWYARVAPASWRTAQHVRKGREQLNFSDWPQSKPWIARTQLESIAGAVREDRMPPSDYRLLHAAARLSPEDRAALADWAQAQADSLQTPRAE